MDPASLTPPPRPLPSRAEATRARLAAEEAAGSAAPSVGAEPFGPDALPARERADAGSRPFPSRRADALARRAARSEEPAGGASLDDDSSSSGRVDPDPRSSMRTPPKRKREKREPKGLLDRFTTATLSIGSGMRASAYSVLAFSILAIALWLLPGAAWTFGPVVALAGIVLAFGWNALTGIELPTATVGVLALSGVVIPMSVAATGDFASAVPLVGISLITLVAATVASAPSPRDRSIVDARTSEDSAASSPTDEAPTIPKRVAIADGSTPSHLVLADAISALALISGGTAWVALDALAQCAVVVPIAAVVVAAVVWGDQLGRTYRSQSLGALAAGVVSGLAAAGAAWGLGRATSLMPIVLPGLAESIGRLAAVSILGVVSGVAVALAVIVLDGLLGDHERRRPPLGALARGAAKFLIASIPVYAMIRIGGI